MRNILFLVLLSIFITGCSNKNDYFNSKNYFASKDVDNTVIADDMYNFISSYYKPNQTTFYIHTSSLDKSFYNYLAQKFRSNGYAVTNNDNIENLTFLSYNINTDSNMVLVTYNINASKVNRIYIIKDYKLVPAGEITGFNFGN